MKTFTPKKSDITKKWVVIDAKDQVLGRVASKAAAILRGKTKPIFTPHMDAGDNVIIINAAQVRMTGNKWDKKIYYHHTGFHGGIKETRARELMTKKPAEMLKKAIHGMLPKNRLGRTLRKNLKVYTEEEHPHNSQKPEPVTIER